MVEFVATDRKAFVTLLQDPAVTVFLRGRDSLAAIQAEFLKHKKNFDFTKFGVMMP